MEFELRFVSEGSIPKSLTKAHQYRLLNEPMHAESICRDVLGVDEANQQALNILLLAITDQFDSQLQERFSEALVVRTRLSDPYRRVYLEGLIYERRALAIFRRGGEGVEREVYKGLVQAMESYERAMELSPSDNDDAILRWNTCVRTMMRYPQLAPSLTG